MQDRGRQYIQFISVNGGAAPIALSGESTLDDMQVAPDGKTMIYTRQSGSNPAEIFRAASGGGAEIALTHLNDAILSSQQLSLLEEFWVDGAENARVQSFLVKPPASSRTRNIPR